MLAPVLSSQRVVIVVDTSVLVWAFLGPGGPSREVLRRCLQGTYVPLMGVSLFHEHESVLGRSELLDRSPLTPAERRDLLDAYLRVCRWTRVYFTWRPNLRDEGDNHVLELAVAGGAETIVTNNTRDFRGGDLHFEGLRILTPQAMLKG